MKFKAGMATVALLTMAPNAFAQEAIPSPAADGASNPSDAGALPDAEAPPPCRERGVVRAIGYRVQRFGGWSLHVLANVFTMGHARPMSPPREVCPAPALETGAPDGEGR